MSHMITGVSDGMLHRARLPLHLLDRLLSHAVALRRADWAVLGNNLPSPCILDSPLQRLRRRLLVGLEDDALVAEVVQVVDDRLDGVRAVLMVDDTLPDGGVRVRAFGLAVPNYKYWDRLGLAFLSEVAPVHRDDGKLLALRDEALGMLVVQRPCPYAALAPRCIGDVTHIVFIHKCLAWLVGAGDEFHVTGAVRRLFPLSERAGHEIELILALVDVEAAVLLAALHGRLLVVLVRVNGVVGVLFI